MLKQLLKPLYCGIFTCCVTIAAIHFDKSGLLWWYIAALIIMLSETSTQQKNEEDKKEN